MNLGRKLKCGNLAIVFPHFRMLPTEDFAVRKTVVFARCSLGASGSCHSTVALE